MFHFGKIARSYWLTIAVLCLAVPVTAWAADGDRASVQPIMGWLAGLLLSLIIFMVRRSRTSKTAQRRVRSRYQA